MKNLKKNILKIKPVIRKNEEISIEGLENILVNLYDENKGDMNLILKQLRVSNMYLEDVAKYSPLLIALFNKADTSYDMNQESQLIKEKLRKQSNVTREMEVLF